MPRIESERVLPFLWIAWEQNDYGERRNVTVRPTNEWARNVVVRKIIKEQG